MRQVTDTYSDLGGIVRVETWDAPPTGDELAAATRTACERHGIKLTLVDGKGLGRHGRSKRYVLVAPTVEGVLAAVDDIVACVAAAGVTEVRALSVAPLVIAGKHAPEVCEVDGERCILVGWYFVVGGDA